MYAGGRWWPVANANTAAPSWPMSRRVCALTGNPSRRPGVDESRDKVIEPPPGFVVSSGTSDTPVASFESKDGRIVGVQFHPEVVHTPQGETIIRNFLFDVARLRPDWTMRSFIETTVEHVRERVAERTLWRHFRRVDSSVMVALLHQALGDQLHPIFVNNGLLRKNEAVEVLETFREHLGINLTYVDASGRFLERLRDVTDPERKRKIIGEEFIKGF